MRTWLVAFATAMSVALCLTMCACGSPGHSAGAAGAAQDSARRSQLEAVVQCLRAHGVSDFPDPVYDSSTGQWNYGDYRRDIPQRAEQACQHLDPSAVSPSPPVPQAQFLALVRLAQCIRQHGVPTWPDPDPLGEFRLPPSLMEKTNPNPVEDSAIRACQRYVPSGGIDRVNAANP
jgi:hypothetical protein